MIALKNRNQNQNLNTPEPSPAETSKSPRKVVPDTNQTTETRKPENVLKINLKPPTLVYTKKQQDTTTTDLKPEDTKPAVTNQNQHMMQDNKTKVMNIFEEMMKPKPKPNTTIQTEPGKPVKISARQPSKTKPKTQKTKPKVVVSSDTSEIDLKSFLAAKKRDRELQQRSNLANSITIQPANHSPSIPRVSATLSPPSNSRPQSAPRAVSDYPGGISADAIGEENQRAENQKTSMSGKF